MNYKGKDGALAWSQQQAEALRKIPSGEPAATPAEFLAIIEARRHHVPLMDAVHHWRRTAGASAGKTVGDLITAREEASKKDALSANYRKTLRMVLRRARERFGALAAISITPCDLQAFIDEQAGISSQRLARAILGSVFINAVKKQWLQSNPMAGVTLPKEDRPAEIEIFTPEDAKAWIQAVAEHSPQWLACWSIKLFAGLRAAEVERLDWSKVKLARGFIEVSAGIAKTEARRLVTIQPNLSKILQPLATTGKVCPPGPSLPTVLAAGRYGKEIPKNAARHSFVSYHLAMFNDYALTEMQAGHSRKMLLQNYRELVTREEAEAYFSILP